MQTDIYNDVTSMRIELNELRTKFDKSLRAGENFEDVKTIHAQIKELECHLNALEWQPERFSGPRPHGDPYTRGTTQRRFRHVEEPPPLL